MTQSTLATTVFCLAAGPCALFLWNLLLYRRAPRASGAADESSSGVSVLIPARDEEKNICAAVEAALASEGVDLEVIVLDDHSGDRTAEIVREIAATDSRLVLQSPPALPPGWCGKSFACDKLAAAATKPFLLFVDADVRLHKDGAARLVTFLESRKKDFVSGVPLQHTRSFLERLLIPLIHFVLLAYLPFIFMRLFNYHGFATGCGQFSMSRAQAYRKSGGYAKIPLTRQDGLKLPGVFRRAGCTTDLVDATDLMSCRLYGNAREVWNGLHKNATEGLGAPTTILPMAILLLGGHVLPFLALAAAPFYEWEPDSLGLFAAAAALALLPRLLAVVRFRQPLFSALLHPLGIVVLESIQWSALLGKIAGRKPSWKGRSV